MSTSLDNRRVRFYVLSSLFAALTAAGAFIRIPLVFVPFTLQDFFVIVSGAVLGPIFGAFSQMLYLVVGLLGAPVFSQGGGPGYVLQPTFGYLLAFPLAAFVCGFIIWGRQHPSSHRLPGYVRMLLASAAALLVIFVFGVTVLYFNLNYIIARPISLTAAVWTGFVVFIPGSLIKLLVAPLLAGKLVKVIF